MVRDCHGLREGIELVPGRAMAAIVDISEEQSVAFVSVYGVAAVGMNEENMSVLAALGEFLRAMEQQRIGVIVGGDWNLTPQDLRRAAWMEQVGATLVYEALSKPTCRVGKRRGRVLDYFAVTNTTAASARGGRGAEPCRHLAPQACEAQNGR